MSSKYKERGQALIIIAFAIIALVGMVGLAIDGGAKFSDRRKAQNAADTAALAAALAKVDSLIMGVSDNSPTTNAPTTCPPPNGVVASPVCDALQIAGLDRAVSNGYGNNLTTNTVEIYSPPISGYYSTISNSDEYVQVIINSNVSTTFARVFGFNELKNHVEAVALSKPGYDLADGAMIISYDPDPNCSVGGTGGYSVEVTGNATVNLNGGGIFLNSDEVCGFKIPNCADLNISSGAGISSVGADNIDQNGCSDPAPEFPNQESLVVPDDVYFPPEPIECKQTATAQNVPLGSDTWYISPGYYTDFPQYNINGDKIVGNKKDIIMLPGVYCVGGDIKWSGTTFNSLDGSSGITIYLKSGYEFDLNINSPITLNATSDTNSDYQGYLIIQRGTPANIGSCVINGGAYLDINGLIYAPYCDITVNGQAGETAVINAQLVGWDIKINGTNTINFSYDPNNQVKVKRRVGLMK